jgi:hypothetical protein
LQVGHHFSVDDQHVRVFATRRLSAGVTFKNPDGVPDVSKTEEDSEEGYRL